MKYTLGEKLVVFIEFKKKDPSNLRSQDDRKRLIDKHQRSDSLKCHSE